MKMVWAFLIYLIAAALSNFFLPWWVMVPVFIVIAYSFSSPPRQAFLLAFFSVLVLWSGWAWYLDAANEQLLSRKIAELLKVPSHHWLIAISGIIGGLAGGLGALTGAFLRKEYASKGKNATVRR